MNRFRRLRSHVAAHADIYRMGAAAAAAALLVALFILTQPVELRRHNTLLGYFGQLKSDEALLGEAVLQLNFSLSNNYDQVTAIIGRMGATVRQLRQGDDARDLRREAEFQSQLQGLEDRIAGKGDALERFKSRNAVLKNSLIYLPHARDQLVRGLGGGTGVRERVDDLIEYVLLNRLNGALLERGDLDQAIEALQDRTRQLPAAVRQGSETLVRHIRQIDQFERDLPDLVQQLTSHTEDGGLAEAYQRYYDRQQERAVAYRFF
ncbi:MAG TPA: DAHL domain-containing protein, partial [Rhodocyclaceae bacterium]|nr:DAHL domain-containing protein [Rhodocyclaceae bacterium]